MNLPQDKIRLRDGRSLGFLECGDPEGKPIFYFHGFPGSRLEVQFADKTASRQNIRMIGIDRPGYGFSDDKQARTFIDWPDDVAELADAIGIDRFSVLGVSGGGPYAAACAYKQPHRLTSAGIVCGVGPIDAVGVLKGMFWINRFGLSFAARAPWIIKLAMAAASLALRRHAKITVAFLAGRSKDPDRKELKRPDIMNILSASFKESMRSGPSGASRDVFLYASSWGFDLQKIRVPIHLWHGEKDDIVPIAMARYLADTIPNCRASFYRDEGHFSLVVKYMEEILRVLVA